MSNCERPKFLRTSNLQKRYVSILGHGVVMNDSSWVRSDLSFITATAILLYKRINDNPIDKILKINSISWYINMYTLISNQTMAKIYCVKWTNAPHPAKKVNHTLIKRLVFWFVVEFARGRQLIFDKHVILKMNR